jgi:hypothetical protein
MATNGFIGLKTPLDLWIGESPGVAITTRVLNRNLKRKMEKVSSSVNENEKCKNDLESDLQFYADFRKCVSFRRKRERIFCVFTELRSSNGEVDTTQHITCPEPELRCARLPVFRFILTTWNSKWRSFLRKVFSLKNEKIISKRGRPQLKIAHPQSTGLVYEHPIPALNIRFPNLTTDVSLGSVKL